jgi:hypothetical protein
MLDDFLSELTRPWIQSLRVGDIVLYRFPLVDPGDGHDLKPRPCIVADIADIHGMLFLELIPGTQAPLPEPIAEDIATDATAFCGDLSEGDGWRFLSKRAVKVDAIHARFVSPPDETSPVVGRLYGSALEQLEALRAAREASRARHLAAKRNKPKPNRRPERRAR